MAEQNVIDTYGPVELFSEMFDEFGPQRTAGLVGWAVIIGALAGPGQSLPEIRDRVIALGFAKSSVYRAAADIKRFRQRLEKKRGLRMSMDDVIREISDTALQHRVDVVQLA